MSVCVLLLEIGFTFSNFKCSEKVLLLIKWLILTKKNSEKMSAFDLMILVVICTSWEAFKISSSQVTFLTSSKVTLKGKSTTIVLVYLKSNVVKILVITVLN